MKLTFSFQTLIMSVLAASLTLATAVWAVTVYESIYSIILRGFDQKLLALAGGAAVLTDGDAHADYHRAHRITAICGGAEGALWGYDEERRMLVVIDALTSGALPLDPAPALPAAALRELACEPSTGSLLAVDVENALHVLAGPALAAGIALDELDEVLSVDGVWWARRGRELLALDGSNAVLALAESIDRLAFDGQQDRFVGVAIEAGELLVFAADGSVASRFDINLDGKRIHGLVAQGDAAYLASDTLLTADLAAGTIGAEPPSPGYYSEEHPFIARFAPAYRDVREAAGLTFLYTDVSLGGDQIRYILDGSVGDDHTPPGYLDVVPEDSLDDMLLGFTQGKPFVSEIRQWEAWGLMKVAAEPIFASDGRVVALAGADVDIGVIRGKTRIALFAVLAVGVGLLLLAASVSFRVSQGLTRPLREIKDSALRIAAGYFDTQLAAGGRDEIAGLAASLNTLSRRLQSQARQSQAYERTLISGRMQLALEHALADELALALAAVPEIHRDPLRPIEDDDLAVAGRGEVCLIWQLAEPREGLAHAVAQASCLQLARALLEKLEPAMARDALFQSSPQLAAVLLWERAEQRLSLRCRSAPVLRCEDERGAQTLAVGDGACWSLAGGQRLHIGAHWHLQSHAVVEGSA